MEESPKMIAEENFYKTAADLEAAVNAVYSPIRNNMYANYVAALECHSDWLYGRGSWVPLGGDYQGLNDANITRVSGFWNGFYLAIRNANLVIKNAPESYLGAEGAAIYIAEAKFLRGLSYLNLVRNWSGVPLRTELNMEQKDLSKSTASDVYELIVEDLLFAEANLSQTHSSSGKPSAWSAKAVLSDVYLDLGMYAESEGKSKQVIESGNFSLVKVSSKSDFQLKIFGPEILSSTEELFAFKFARFDGQGNYILWISNHPSTNLYAFGGAYAVHSFATNPNYVAWDAADIRKSLWDKINFGLGANTLVSSKYTDPQAVSNNGAGNDQPVYRYSDVLLNYAEASAKSQNMITLDALDALNQVHRRAYGHDPEQAAVSDYDLAGLTVDGFVDLVIKERGYEFQYEGKRWHELKRTGKAATLIQYGKGKSIAEKHLLWPIPISEINYNEALDPVADQNPGY